ncbi:hypothetical protein [Blautia sp. Marseille-P3087]|uniref:hypothetical protein n=1 Tax=Blautia sp. Marseille-P3087 TaxID=1917876 RepID=UPI0009318D1D|nr:hypothetical protein [Blautia sp. Marseille-P3087]
MCKKNYATKLCAVMTAMSIVLSGCAQSTGTDVNDNSSSTSENQITEEANNKIAEDIEAEADDIIDSEDVEESSLTPTQRNSVNMLNYMSALTQEINASSGNQMFLEEAYSSLVNDIYPNAVDTETQAEITSLMDTIENYRMITVKRKRLEYIYEQNRAQALRQKIPNPVGVLSAVQSGSILKSAASVLYMAVDSVSSYKAATSQADLQYIQDGWELEDQELTELHNSTKNALSYMFDMVRDYNFDGDYALSEEAIKDFVKWKSKPDSQLISKIEWFKSHKDTYQNFGRYWLELVKDYYNSEDYENCIESIRQYESVSTRIFRKDTDKANVLPMVIIAAKETLSEAEYIELANSYCSEIYDNTKDDDWSLRYFVAQIYMDLNILTKDELYLEKAYEIALGNVNVLVDEQRTLNKTYMEEIQKIEADKDSTKREKEEIKKYNKLLKEQRKVELPPVSEALYLNIELLFALANEMQVSDEEQKRINAILHENGNEIFLTKALDNRFWFGKKSEDINLDEVEISFDGENLSIPAAYIAEGYAIQMTISGGKKDTQIEDWSVKKVKRPKKEKECSEFVVSFESKKAKDYKYHVGDKITIKVDPVADTPDGNITLNYKVKSSKKFGVFDGIKFERQK